MDIINLYIGFVMIPWLINTTCPKNITRFKTHIYMEKKTDFSNSSFQPFAIILEKKS